MRTIFITIILIGLFESFSGQAINAESKKSAIPETFTSIPHISTAPRFTEINGSLFLAVNTEKSLRLAEGAVIQFDFGKNGIIKSFHVNDANQNIIDQGGADILVMIHQELALALRKDKLSALKIIDDLEEIDFIVDDFWPPHVFLTGLK